MNGAEEVNCGEATENNLPSSPHVKIFLKPMARKIDFEESSNVTPDIFQSLIQRQSALDYKLSNLRMVGKANEMSQMRQVPEINDHSRKIMESKTTEHKLIVPESKEKNQTKVKNERKNNTKKLKKKDAGAKKEKKKKRKGKFESILKNPMSPDIFKHSKSQEILEILTPTKKKSVIERISEWKKNRDKVLEQKRHQKDLSEMLECTFTPQLSPTREFSDTKSMFSASRYSTRSPQILCLTEVPPIPCDYSQISPFMYKVSYDCGYNRHSFLAKANPMACYNFENSLDSSSDSI